MAKKITVRSMKNKNISNAKKDIIGRSLNVKAKTPAQTSMVNKLASLAKSSSRPLKAWKKIKQSVAKAKSNKTVKPISASFKFVK